jgi:hypothetical protein
MFADAGSTLGYFVRWLGLSLYGPAQFGDQEDPLERLRRRYGRVHKDAGPQPMGLQDSYDNLPD